MAFNAVRTMASAVQIGLGIHDLRLILVLEDVGQGQGAALKATILGQPVQRNGSKVPDRTLSDGDQTIMLVDSRHGRHRAAADSGHGRREYPQPAGIPAGACRRTGSCSCSCYCLDGQRV